VPSALFQLPHGGEARYAQVPNLPPRQERAHCGRIADAADEVIDCDTDKQAIEKAKRMVDGRGIEVWQCARRVSRRGFPYLRSL
jgi:hypothetical protein